METLRITSFEDLIGHLDGLTVAARRSPVDQEAVAFAAQFRARLVRIHNHLLDKPATCSTSRRTRSRTPSPATKRFGTAPISSSSSMP